MHEIKKSNNKDKDSTSLYVMKCYFVVTEITLKVDLHVV